MSGYGLGGTYVDPLTAQLAIPSIVACNVQVQSSVIYQSTYVAGNVGFGTTLPQNKLYVNATSSNPALLVNQQGRGNVMELQAQNNTLVILDANGNVGLGTTLTNAALHVHNGDVYIPGSIIQCITTSYAQQTTYSAPNSITPTEMSVLNLNIAPKRSNSQIFLDWNITGEAVADVVFLVYRNTTPIGYNSASNAQWSGVAAIPLDIDTASTPANIRVSWIDSPNTTSTVTYSVRVRSSTTATAYTMSLNRTGNSVGASAYEATCSQGIAYEICV